MPIDQAEHRAALDILQQVRGEIKLYESQHRGMLQIERVVNLYQDLVKEIPGLEKRREEIVEEIQALTERQQNEVTIHKKKIQEARDDYQKTVQQLGKAAQENRAKEAKLFKEIEDLEKMTSARISELQAEVVIWEEKLETAKTAFDNFKKAIPA